MTDYTKWCALNKKTKASKGGTQLWDKWRVMSGALVKLLRYELFQITYWGRWAKVTDVLHFKNYDFYDLKALAVFLRQF